MRSPMRSTPVPVGIITTTTAMPAAVTPMPGAARMTPLMTLHLPQVFSPEGLGRCLRLLGSECCGQVLRAKGIVETETGFLNVQFLPGEHRFEKTNLQEHELCVIGHDLNRAQITAVFEGVC